jgi:hypothetical protein
MKRFRRKQWALLAAFALIVAITGVFVVRTVRRTIYWRVHHDEPIRPWMSLPYVAHSYRVPPYILYEALGITPSPRDRRPIREIAKEQNRSVDEVILDLQNAIARERASHPAGPPPPADRGRSP